ncbi:hypothetical protein [Telluria beijingensis]|uniref:hypothetical protein n=1 Tax=Telluria beijingensis TaxID=3068633 RepID=UPI002795367B|nr:hypothetical protein [Massilia sp. REN29]
MAITKQPATILASTNVPAGTTAAAPVAGGAVDVRAFAGGEWAYKITNGSSAPTVPATLVLQTSHDGANWYDYFTVGGTTVASGVSSGSVAMSAGVMYIRVIAYGNATTAVTVESYLQARVG